MIDEMRIPLTPEERQRRREAIDGGHASLFLSGFEISQKAMARAQLYVDGVITLDELINSPIGDDMD